MAEVQVVISAANDNTPALGSLFNGTSFFLVQRVPARSSYVQKIQSNGGRVVKLETQADYIIADHFRRDCPPGSLSYQFIDAAIRSSSLPDPQDHLAGPPQGTVRDVGSTVPGKQTRTPFTAEDDKVLWQWVERSRLEGGLVKGNEIYKQLEAKNGRHTFQAWRDRYVKKLMHQPPAGVQVTVAANAPPSPPDAPDVEDEEKEASIRPESARKAMPKADSRSPATSRPAPSIVLEDASGKEEPFADFTPNDFETLLAQVKDIRNIAPQTMKKAFEAWAQAYPTHTWSQWLAYYQAVVLPEWKARRMEKKAMEIKHEQREVLAVVVDDDAVPTKRGVDMIDEAKIVANAKKEAEKARAEGTSDAPLSATKRKHETAKAQDETDADTSSSKRRKVEVSGHVAEDLETALREPAAEKHPSPAPARPQSQTGGRSANEAIDLLSDNEDDEDEEEMGPSKAAEHEAMPTSELNNAAQEQLQAEEALEQDSNDEPHPETLTEAEKADSVLPTSEVNRAADEQLLQAEAAQNESPMDEAQPEANAVAQLADSALPTSEVNRAADQQLRRESLELDADGEHDLEDLQPSNFLTSETNDHAQSQFDLEVLGYGNAETGQALTEANLASQQAEHNPIRHKAVDLTQDDEMQDQSEYVAYLQGLQATTRDAEAAVDEQPIVPERLDKTPSEAESDAIELPAEDMLDEAIEHTQYDTTQLPPDSDDIAMPTAAELPISSQQETDEVFKQNIQWPSSSQHGRHSPHRHRETQSFGFETQVQYPSLTEHFTHGLEEHDEVLSQPPESQAPMHPRLPRQPSVAPEVEDDESYPEQVNNDDLEDADADALSEDDEDDELDLSVPEPDGGFGFSSPVPSRSQAEDVAEAPLPLHELNTHEDLDVPDSSQHADPETVVDISSSDESSSYQSEESREATLRPQMNGRSRALDTQAIMDAETQQPDLGMPLPPDSDDEMSQLSAEDELPSTPLAPISRSFPPKSSITASKLLPRISQPVRTPQPASSPRKALAQSQSSQAQQASQSQRNLAETQTLSQDDIEEYIDRWVARGHTEENVVEALKCTSMRPDLAYIVMVQLKLRKPVPNDVPGVWTAKDDRDLEGTNGTAMKRLITKHGGAEFDARMKFLEEWRQTE